MHALFKWSTFGVLTSLAISSSGWAQSAYEKIEPSAKELAKLQSLTPTDFAKSAAIEDDDLEPLATITTIKGYQNRGKLTDRVKSDNFLRAFLDKRSARVRFQVYQEITYADVRRDFHLVNYATPDGLQTAELVAIGHEIPQCYSGTCVFRDTVGFDVSEELLRTIAAQYAPGQSSFWRFRFKAKSGLDWEDRMAPAEVAGLLQAVSDYRSTHKIAQ